MDHIVVHVVVDNDLPVQGFALTEFSFPRQKHRVHIFGDLCRAQRRHFLSVNRRRDQQDPGGFRSLTGYKARQEQQNNQQHKESL